MKNWWALYLKQPWDKQVLYSAVALAMLPVAFFLWPSAPPPEPAAGTVSELDTHIPKGFVLIPIEVQNYEALDSILGRYGVVDLYQGGGTEGSKQVLAARNVRLLRAPHNPSHFAVLVPESQAQQVLRQGGLFTVIVKRAGETGTEFVKEETRAKRSITYEGG